MGDSLDHPADLHRVFFRHDVIDPLEAESFQRRPLLRDRSDLAANLFDANLAHCDDSLLSLSSESLDAADSSLLVSAVASVSAASAAGAVASVSADAS